MTLYSDEPAYAQSARRRLDDAFYLWEQYGDPPAIVRLSYRIEDGEVWMAAHDRRDPQYDKATTTLAVLRQKLGAAQQNDREVERAEVWGQLEAAFLSAESDYLSIVAPYGA